MREFLRLHLGQWQNDLPLEWRQVFNGAQTNFDTIAADIDAPERIFPTPRSAGGNGNSNLLRPFEKVSPGRVRVILIGQDPYPEQGRATGQAFEDGSVQGIADSTSPSLRRFVASAITAGDIRHNHDHGDLDWAGICNHYRLPTMVEMFDGLAAQGVLSINAAWTFTGTRDRDLSIHLRLWRPVIRHVVQNLLAKNADHVTLAIGGKATKLFNTRNPCPNNFVQHCHPQARNNAWFLQPNPLREVNRYLAELDQVPICWMPGLALNPQVEPNQ